MLIDIQQVPKYKVELDHKHSLLQKPCLPLGMQTEKICFPVSPPPFLSSCCASTIGYIKREQMPAQPSDMSDTYERGCHTTHNISIFSLAISTALIAFQYYSDFAFTIFFLFIVNIIIVIINVLLKQCKR